jgi:hypothetical protein
MRDSEKVRAVVLYGEGLEEIPPEVYEGAMRILGWLSIKHTEVPLEFLQNLSDYLTPEDKKAESEALRQEFERECYIGRRDFLAEIVRCEPRGTAGQQIWASLLRTSMIAGVIDRKRTRREELSKSEMTYPGSLRPDSIRLWSPPGAPSPKIDDDTTMISLVSVQESLESGLIGRLPAFRQGGRFEGLLNETVPELIERIKEERAASQAEPSSGTIDLRDSEVDRT